MSFRCDLISWAQAVLSDELWFCFAGITRPDSQLMRHYQRGRGKIYRGDARSKIVATVCADERFMDDLARAEVDHWVEDDCYGDEWEEACKKETHAVYCPHEDAELYKEELARRLKDEDAKRMWLEREIFEWDDIREFVNMMFDSWEGVVRFLKEHPITAIIAVSQHDPSEYCVVEIEEVVGYCPECNAPAKAEDISLTFETEDEHSRRELSCWACSSTSFVDDDEKSFAQAFGRPFNWPPGAPWPPRRSIDGTPLDVPFYEE